MRNHGVAIAGRTIEEAVTLALLLDNACQIQLLTEAAGGEGLGEEQAGIVEAVLAHHAKQDPAPARGLDHLARRIEGGCNRFLHLHMLAMLGADFDGLQPEIGKGADVYVVHIGMAADLLVARDKFSAVPLGKTAARGLENVCADGQLVANVFVHLRMLF